MARHVASRLGSLCKLRSESNFMVTGGDRQSRIEVYAKLSVTEAEKVLRRIDGCHYSIENVRKETA